MVSNGVGGLGLWKSQPSGRSWDCESVTKSAAGVGLGFGLQLGTVTKSAVGGRVRPEGSSVRASH